MAVTTIPNVTNWSVTPRNGQVGYFSLMNTWLSESTAVIASLQTAITAQNTANKEVNQLAIQTENNANIAASVGNYQGVWSNLVTYSKSSGVSVGTLYYISKVDNNLNHVVTDTNYWTPSPSNTKLEKDFSTFTDKTTPSDTDNIPLWDGSNKKLTWANIKATIISSFGVMISTLTAKTTPVDADIFTIGDSASSNTSKKLTLGNLKTHLNTVYLNFVANDSRVATALNATGGAPIYACRAWVNFNGTGTVAIRASGNVSSITDNRLGDYTINFTTAMPDANYVMTQSGQGLANDRTGNLSIKAGASFYTTSVNVVHMQNASADNGAFDPTNASLAFFR